MVHAKNKNAVVVWGGQQESRHFNDGASLDLATLSWTRIPVPSPKERSRHTAVWTGERMIIFGGEVSNSEYAEEIGSYELSSTPGRPGRWHDVLGEYFPFRVKSHSAVWTGKEMIVWGGQSNFTAFENIGAKFFPGEQ